MIKPAPIFNRSLAGPLGFPGRGNSAVATVASSPPASDHTTAIISEQTLNWFLAEDDSVILSEE